MYKQVAIIYHDKYVIDNTDHPLKSDRFEYIYSSLVGMEGIHPHTPKFVSNSDLKLIHTDDYLISLNHSQKIAEYFEFPQNQISREIADQILSFSLAMTGGTVLATSLIDKYNIVINLGGGFHHAKPDKGEGFCLFNDIAIAVKKLRPKYKKILIVDLDAHQGNGTIVCLEDDEDTFTFDMHDRNIYPLPKEIGNLDIQLDEGITDKEYFSSLKLMLPTIMDEKKPDIVLYVAGADVLDSDYLTEISMSPLGVIERDQLVIELCKYNFIPVIMMLSGGYSEDAKKVQYHSIMNIINRSLK